LLRLIISESTNVKRFSFFIFTYLFTK